MNKWFLPLRARFSERLENALQTGEFQQEVRSLHEGGKLSSELTSYLLQVPLWLGEATELLVGLEEQGILVMLNGDFGFPEELAEIADPPTILFLYGDVEILNSPNKITLVGTRVPSLWGREKAAQFAFESASCGLVTVSGLAQGIDTIVFEETRRYTGKTIAVLPQLLSAQVGADTCGTLYLSEYPPSQQEPSKWQFIARNRLQAGLGRATVVIEAPIRSGTLITAELAQMYDKSVYVVLPDPHEDVSYGGLTFSLTNLNGMFVQSLYDVAYQEGWNEVLNQYKKLVERVSRGRISLQERDHRHLASANLSRNIAATARGDLSVLESTVLELQRFGIIKERKNRIVFNFSGYAAWPKI